MSRTASMAELMGGIRQWSNICGDVFPVVWARLMIWSAFLMERFPNHVIVYRSVDFRFWTVLCWKHLNKVDSNKWSAVRFVRLEFMQPVALQHEYLETENLKACAWFAMSSRLPALTGVNARRCRISTPVDWFSFEIVLVLRFYTEECLIVFEWFVRVEFGLIKFSVVKQS